uniref:DDE-1 domain-containing protein n=1 Tax=Plectus sambesii TaxID=2011161 RepID=A0A914WZJ4_9BILA
MLHAADEPTTDATNRSGSLKLMRSYTIDLPGAGRKPLYPEIDKALLDYFRAERSRGHSVTYTVLRAFVNSPSLGVDKHPDFKVSDKYLFCWTKRNNISSRRITHHGQIDLRTKADVKAVLTEYFKELRQRTAGIPANRVIQMDETPCYFDMTRDSTLSFRGSKNVDGADTGYRKQRYTVCLAISLDGRLLKTMVIFRGLKKIPSVTVPNSKIVIAVSKSGSMDSSLAKFWMDNVFAQRGPYFATTPSVLLWDCHRSHKRDDVVKHLKNKYKSKMVLIPAKMTYMAQPLDVSINAPFKSALKNEWAAWLRDTPPLYTPSGYRKRPSYQEIIDMVSLATDAIQMTAISRAFETCGIAPNGQEVPTALLNERLRDALSCEESVIGLREELSELNDDDDEGAGADSGDEVLEERTADDEPSDDYSDEYN